MPPLTLAIVQEAQALGFLASNGRSHGVFERVPLGDHAVPRARLPQPVQHWLAHQSDGLLQLQLTGDLAAWPWEQALVDGQPLDDRFTVVRQWMGQAAGPPPRRAASAATVQAPARMRVLRIDANGPTDPARIADTVALGAEVLWWTAPLPEAAQRAVWLAALSACPCPPRLLLASVAPAGGADPAVLQWVGEACRAGFSVLVLPVAAAQADAALAPFWQALDEGLPLAQAARRLRQAAAAMPALASAALAWFYGDAAPAPGLAEGAHSPDDDVRQCTMLKCDLVDSTRQMGTLGDEAYAERLAQFHAAVAATVQQHGGIADDPQGDDGFMCYFGFPVAREDAPARALRAGLALVQAVAALDWQVRVGISTGRVVVKDGQPVGSAIHHAARLQALAVPGTVLVADSTQALAAEGFEFTLVEREARLKGFDHGGAVWRLERERPVLGTERFDARSRLTRFVGREDELALLQRSWAATTAGKPQAWLLSGEAGIGKSRLVREFRRQLAERGAPILEYRCAPEHSGSALQPVIELLRRQLRLAGADSPAEALARLRRSGLATLGGDEALALAAELLSLPTEGLPPLRGDAAQRRQRTMNLLVRWMRLGAASRPLVLIVEDVHWIDPSTRELVRSLMDGRAGTPLLVLLTLRSGASSLAGGAAVDDDAGFGPEVQRLLLTGLPNALACAMLRDACGAAVLSEEAERWLAARADGVPLFIEESARMAVALAQSLPAPSGAAPDPAQAAPALSRPVADLALREAVPPTLEGLLTARLDQLPTARRAAQLGSAIGRSFALALVEAVNAHGASPIRLHDLAHELAVLERAGLIGTQGDGAQRVGTFKHALLRDAAHRSLLARDRRRLHGAIAQVLAQRFAGLVAAQPELLAHHLEQAGELAAALGAWERAARHAVSRSSQQEAIGHLRHALALLRSDEAALLPAPDRDRTELRLQMLLAARLIATAGYGADEVEAVYGRALALAQALDDGSDRLTRLKVQLGLEGWHFMRGDFARAMAIAQQVAQGLGPDAAPSADAPADAPADDLPLRFQSRWALANIVFHQGQLQRAVAMMDEDLAAYGRIGHRAAAVQDPVVMCRCYTSWGLWVLGRVDEALDRARAVVALAEGLGHRFSMGQAHGFLAVAHWFRGETDAGLAAAQRAIAICEEGGFAVWLAHARVVHGSLRVTRGVAEDDADAVAAGHAEMAQGEAAWAATGAVVTRPFYLSLRAEGLVQDGRPAEALALLQEAWAQVQRSGERWWAPELARAIGELQGALADPDGPIGPADPDHAPVATDSAPARAPAAPEASAEPWLQRALAEARALGLHALVLRAAMSLGRHQAARGRTAEAAALLQPALDALPEGRDTRDLCAARALLAQWQATASGPR